MASESLDDAEKIVRMTEWNEHEPWECDTDEHSGDYNLAAAKRFMAAQSFLLSWQEGKVPTGWRRARRLADFDGKYPKSVVDAAEDIISQEIETRNLEKTARLNAVVSSRSESCPDDKKNGRPTDSTLDKQEIETLKADFSTFSHDFFEAKSALNRATTAIADISFRIEALSEILE